MFLLKLVNTTIALLVEIKTVEVRNRFVQFVKINLMLMKF